MDTTTPAREAPLPLSRSVISIAQLNHSFGSGELKKQVLHNITLTIEGGRNCDYDWAFWFRKNDAAYLDGRATFGAEQAVSKF